MAYFFDMFSYNKSVFSGAMDMVVVKQPDDTFKCTPLRVRFGQFRILRAKEKKVQIEINGNKVDINMRLTEQGEAYVIHENKRKDIDIDKERNSIDGYASPNDMGLSAPTSPRQDSPEELDTSPKSIQLNANEIKVEKEKEKERQEKSLFFEGRKKKGLSSCKRLSHRKSSFDIVFHPKDKVKVIKEHSFSIDSSYSKGLNANMNLLLSNSWGVISKKKDDPKFNLEETFTKSLFTKEEFWKDPWKILNNANLAIKYDSHIYTWKVIAPLIVSQLAFGESLPNEDLKRLTQQLNGYLYWKSVDQNAFKINISKTTTPTSASLATPSIPTPPQQQQSITISTNEITMTQSPLSPVLLAENKTKPLTTLLDKQKLYPLHPQYKRSYNLSTEQLQSLNLNYGKNTIKFIVTSSYQGRQELKSDIYLWNYDDKIVVSDLDGTITRTDVIGQIFPFFGKDWSHKCVAKLFNNIEKNGYKILYLTARAICQHNQTKNYLTSLQQDNLRMPISPILMSPDGLMSSFKREIIDRTPQSFKIMCLTQILNLFPDETKPFYAGIGNKKTDAISYESIGIKMPRIFIINEKGEISSVNKCYKTTYEQMNEIVDHLFPFINGNNTLFDSTNYFKPSIEQNNWNINDLFK